MRGPGEKCVSASKKTQVMEKGISSKSRQEVREVELDKEDSDFECYDRSEGTPVHVDINKEITEASRH